MAAPNQRKRMSRLVRWNESGMRVEMRPLHVETSTSARQRERCRSANSMADGPPPDTAITAVVATPSASSAAA
jgi:hypothetical protein